MNFVFAKHAWLLIVLPLKANFTRRTPLVITEAWRHYFCCTNFLSQLCSKQGVAWIFAKIFQSLVPAKGRWQAGPFKTGHDGTGNKRGVTILLTEGSFRCSRWRICSSAKSEAPCSWRRRRRRSKDRRSLLWVASCTMGSTGHTSRHIWKSALGVYAVAILAESHTTIYKTQLLHVGTFLIFFGGPVWHFSLFQGMVRSSKAYRTCLEQRSPCSNGRFREEKERAPHSLASWWSYWLSVCEAWLCKFDSFTGERGSILIFLHSHSAAAILGITRTSWPGHEVCLTKMPHLRYSCTMVRWCQHVSTTFRYRNEHIARRVGKANVGHGIEILLHWGKIKRQKSVCGNELVVNILSTCRRNSRTFVQNGVNPSLGCSQSHTKASMLKASGTKLVCRASEEMIRNAAAEEFISSFIHTVDGSKKSLNNHLGCIIMGYLPYQLVQDFFHKQYHTSSWLMSVSLDLAGSLH